MMRRNTWMMTVSLAAALVIEAGAYSYEVNTGWNLLGATEEISNLENFSALGDRIYIYDTTGWQKFLTASSDGTLEQGVGFWFLAQQAGTVSDGGAVANPDDGSADDSADDGTRSFNLPDTGQDECFNSSGSSVSCSGSGQDGATTRNAPSYTDNGDGTVTDNVTGLIWQKSADTDGDGDIDADDKKSQTDSISYCESLDLGGYTDWRLPDIKQMYSLIDFSGWDISVDTGVEIPFVDTDAFDFGYGDEDAGERTIDAQWATTSIYTSTTMGNENETMFGVNLADGRIKGYPTTNKTFYVYCVRGNESYGVNDFNDNGDNTITDQATGLMWQQSDSGSTVEWDDAISACESATTAGYSDWRLPNAKELESIVDYNRSPDYTNSAAIDPLFNATSFIDEAGQTDYGFYWTSTTHISGDGDGSSAAYIAFGEALGYWNEAWEDVHGAGCQRSDPKAYPTGANLAQYDVVDTATGGTALSNGPQGDVIRGYNYYRCVRDAE